ncbi:hypothetical protein [Bradymonas sediminis]|uniref:Uncharacterized protein n=1 Tax=Bradymonas sediminis TaxID=1548548 RepID=A0A2Z4FNB8_9DELT|nr:hypothetical protein [Bradymonas sediminis]AWV90275.1 hypothetical protein DN745_13415 [Bradymonas sediminis]TDP75757.1 hypothetical protein DFR33_10396 [Bradymonas sediminis]
MSALTGCQTMQGWLNTESEAPIAGSNQTPESNADRALRSSEHATAIALERARAYAQGRADAYFADPAKNDVDTPSQATMRTLERKKARPAGNPLELINPTIADARVELSADLRGAYRASVKEDDDPEIFTGNFSSKPGTELVVFKPGKEVVVYSKDSRIARLPLSGDAAPEAFAELGLELDPSGVQAVDIVQDNTLQLLTHRRMPTEDGTFAYKVSVLKVIGPFIGEVFSHTLATSETEDGPLTRVGTYEFLRGEDHRDIRWIPADDNGEWQTDQAVVLKWNQWEGMYRVPAPPAAAPKRNQIQVSENSAPHTPTKATLPTSAALSPRYLSTNPG